MPSLSRHQATSSTQLLMRILERPELVSAVRELPAPVLGKLIDHIGLEDAGELVALASSEQLEGVFDQDLWRAEAPGADEQFRPERFALWLDVMFEGGEAFLVERLCALPRDLLALALHRLVLVLDMDVLGEQFSEPSEDLERLERALEAPLFEEWEEFRLLARDPMHWDTVWTALLALDRDHHHLLRALLEQCCALSSEYIDENGGLYDVLTSDEMLEGDVAGEREDRRAAEGFVSPADARSFLGLARSGEAGDERDAITRAYFRNLGGAPVSKREPARGTRLVAADLGKLTQVLEEAEVVGSTASQPIAALGSGRGASPRKKPLTLFQRALAELRSAQPAVFSQRIEELGFLANVLIAGSTGWRPRPVEAMELAIEHCGVGLTRLLGERGALARAIEALAGTPADVLFRRGYGAAADGGGVDRARVRE